VRFLALWRQDKVDYVRTGQRVGKRGSNNSALRVSLYDEVTAKIIAQLEAGIFP
jgi:hypothetical protein